MARTERYFVGPSLLGDIRRTISRVNSDPYTTSGPRFDAVHQTLPTPAGGGVRLGTISTTWAKGTTATVTRLNGDGTTITPTTTFVAWNHFGEISVNYGLRKVACGDADGEWILIAAEC